MATNLSGAPLRARLASNAWAFCRPIRSRLSSLTERVRSKRRQIGAVVGLLVTQIRCVGFF